MSRVGRSALIDSPTGSGHYRGGLRRANVGGAQVGEGTGGRLDLCDKGLGLPWIEKKITLQSTGQCGPAVRRRGAAWRCALGFSIRCAPDAGSVAPQPRLPYVVRRRSQPVVLLHLALGAAGR